MIRVKNLSKTYEGEKNPTIKNVSFMLKDTGLYFIKGESGSGKTTLATILGCMDDNFDGDVFFDEKSYKAMSKNEKSEFRLNNVGFSFQGGFMDGLCTVEDEVMKSFFGSSLSKEERKDRLSKLLIYFELNNYQKRKINELSGGEKKRISLIKAIIKKPKLLIVDEPTAGLNEKLAHKTMSYLEKISSDSLVLVITHDDVDTSKFGLLEVKEKSVKLIDEPADIKKDKEKREGYRKIKLLSLIIQSFKTFIRHMRSAYPAIIAIMISLTSFGIALCMVDGVKSGFISMVSSAFDESTIVVEPKANSNLNGKNVLGDETLVRLIYWDYQKDLLDYGIEYPLNLNDKVDSSFSSLYLNINDNYKYPSNFGVDILAHPLIRKFYPTIRIKGDDYPSLEKDQVFFGLPQAAIDYLFTAFPNMYGFLSNNKVVLNGSIGVKDVSGIKTFQLKVKGFFESSNPVLMHTSTLFSSSLLEDNIGFVTSNNLTSLDVKPHTLKKGGILYVEKEKLGNFYKAFSLDSTYRKYALEKFPSSLKIKTGIEEEVIKLFIREKKLEEINPYDVLDIADRKDDFQLREYAFSSSVYTYVQGGMYAGFSLPVFLAKDRSSLIELSDMNSTTDKNLGMFQISSAQIPEGVIGADLSSSLEGKGIDFISPLDKKVDKGTFSNKDDEIVISSSLARKIYKDKSPIGESLSLLLLGDIKREGNSYKNVFFDYDLTVTGIIENDKDALYQDSFFPQILAFKLTEKSGIDLTIDNAILKFKTKEYADMSLSKLRKDYPAYEFNCPFKDMADDMEDILSKISTGLCIFASISLILSIFLMLLTSYLAIKDDEKGIGDYLALGLKAKEVRTIYILYVMWIGLSSFLQSLIAIIFGNKLVQDELSKVFGETISTFSLNTYFIVLVLCFASSLLVSLLSTKNISKIDPKQGLRL